MKLTKILFGCLWGLAIGAGLTDVVYAEDKEPPTLRQSIDTTKSDFADQYFGLQLSGFGDVRSAYDDLGKQKLDRGAFELDASGDLGSELQGAMAVVNTQATTMMTVGFLDFHTFGGRIAPRGRLWVEKGLHIQAGRFDVPFGNDWQFFASKDSVSISRPLTTDLVMDGGYNDSGVRILGNNGSVNFNTFLLRGFNAGHLLGMRVGLTPFSDPFSLQGAKEPKTFELGCSYFVDTNSTKQKSETGVAVDAEARHGNWSGRLEYMERNKLATVDAATSLLRGWHITQEYVIDDVSWPTTVFARYEQVAVLPAEIATPGATAGDSRDVRLAAGSSMNFGDLVQWKMEVQHYISSTPTTRTLSGYGRSLFVFTQLVMVL